MGKTKVTFRDFFEAAHHLPDSESLTTKKCCNLHGHTYACELEIETDKTVDGFVVDFGTLKDAIGLFDHATIIWDEDTALLEYAVSIGSKVMIIPAPPTAENIAVHMHDVVLDALPLNCIVNKVRILEGTREGKVAWVEYEPTEN